MYEIIRFTTGTIIKLNSQKMLYKGNKIREITIDELHKFDRDRFIKGEFFKEIGDDVTIFRMKLKVNGEPKFTKKINY